MDPAAAGLWALGIAAWFAGSIAWRIASGRGLFARPLPGAVFVERWASGRTGSGVVARLSTARNCLQVQLTRDELVITPHFPFTLLFMPELYDFDKRIALSAVRGVKRLGGRFAEAIELTYAKRDGSEAVLLLLLRQAGPFSERVGAGAAGAGSAGRADRPAST